MRLNLPNSECVQFEIRADFGITSEIENALLPVIEQTSHHSHTAEETGDGDSKVGIFGSRFVIGGISHRAVGNLWIERKDDEPRVDVWMLNRVEEGVSRPPRTIKPVSLMMNAIAGAFGVISAECSAIFEYPQSRGWSSKIALPATLMVPSESSGITHIESAEFSQRDGDSVRYRVAVRVDAERSVIVHTVRYRKDVDWTNGSFRRSLNYAQAVSNRLLAREREGDAQDGTTSSESHKED